MCGKQELKLLINKFGPLVGGEYNNETDFQSFKEQLRSTEFSMYVSAKQVCKFLMKQTFYLWMYPKICSLAQIALKIPLLTHWSELFKNKKSKSVAWFYFCCSFIGAFKRSGSIKGRRGCKYCIKMALLKIAPVSKKWESWNIRYFFGGEMDEILIDSSQLYFVIFLCFQ